MVPLPAHLGRHAVAVSAPPTLPSIPLTPLTPPTPPTPQIFKLLDEGAHIYFCGLKGMMPGITDMLERVSKAKGIDFDPFTERLKHSESRAPHPWARRGGVGQRGVGVGGRSARYLGWALVCWPGLPSELLQKAHNPARSPRPPPQTTSGTWRCTEIDTSAARLARAIRSAPRAARGPHPPSSLLLLPRSRASNLARHSDTAACPLCMRTYAIGRWDWLSFARDLALLLSHSRGRALLARPPPAGLRAARRCARPNSHRCKAPGLGPLQRQS